MFKVHKQQTSVYDNPSALLAAAAQRLADDSLYDGADEDDDDRFGLTVPSVVNSVSGQGGVSDTKKGGKRGGGGSSAKAGRTSSKVCCSPLLFSIYLLSTGAGYLFVIDDFIIHPSVAFLLNSLIFRHGFSTSFSYYDDYPQRFCYAKIAWQTISS